MDMEKAFQDLMHELRSIYYVTNLHKTQLDPVDCDDLAADLPGTPFRARRERYAKEQARLDRMEVGLSKLIGLADSMSTQIHDHGVRQEIQLRSIVTATRVAAFFAFVCAAGLTIR